MKSIVSYFFRNFSFLFCLQFLLLNYFFRVNVAINIIMVELAGICFSYVVLNKQALFGAVKAWMGSILYTGATIFFSKVWAGLIINDKVFINIQYLSNSPIILGLIISFGLSFIFAAIYLFVIGMLSKLKKSVGLSDEFERSYEKEKAPQLRALFIIGVLMSSIPFLQLSDYLSNKVILADSAKVSECGPLLDNIFYIRKNKNECYAIKANIKHWEYSMMAYNNEE